MPACAKDKDERLEAEGESTAGLCDDRLRRCALSYFEQQEADGKQIITHIVSLARGGLLLPAPDTSNECPGMILSPIVDQILD